MRFTPILRRQAYLLAWTTLLLFYVARTAPVLWRDFRRNEVLNPSPYASSDYFLEALLHVSQPSERLNEIFARLPAGRAIVFVSPKKDDRWDFVYSAVCYLAWPRRIERVEIEGAGNPPSAIAEESAVLFCGMPPTVDSRASLRIGPNLVLLTPATAR